MNRLLITNLFGKIRDDDLSTVKKYCSPYCTLKSRFDVDFNTIGKSIDYIYTFSPLAEQTVSYPYIMFDSFRTNSYSPPFPSLLSLPVVVSSCLYDGSLIRD